MAPQGAGDADARAAPDQAPPAANGKPAGGGGPPGGRTVFSLVQLRGSLPLLWSRPPNLELRPEARMCRDLELQGAALQSHLADLRQRYQVCSGRARGFGCSSVCSRPAHGAAIWPWEGGMGS